MTKNEKTDDCFDCVISLSFLHIETSEIPLLKACTDGSILSSNAEDLLATDEDVMTKTI